MMHPSCTYKHHFRHTQQQMLSYKMYWLVSSCHFYFSKVIWHLLVCLTRFKFCISNHGVCQWNILAKAIDPFQWMKRFVAFDPRRILRDFKEPYFAVRVHVCMFVFVCTHTCMCVSAGAQRCVVPAHGVAGLHRPLHHSTAAQRNSLALLLPSHPEESGMGLFWSER